MRGLPHFSFQFCRLTLLIGLLSLTVEGTPNRPCFTGSAARAAIGDWKKDNGYRIVIDGGAAAELSRNLGGGCAEEAADSHSGVGSQDHFVIGSYLYELRDRKYATMGSPAISDHFTIQLGPDDVKAFSFQNFAIDIGASAWQDPGELIVDSIPPGATIMIDGKPRGMTRKDFVISKGKHSILVKLASQSCKDTVEIKDDPFPYQCPKNAEPQKAGAAKNEP
jgi:hypothetical protein